MFKKEKEKREKKTEGEERDQEGREGTMEGGREEKSGVSSPGRRLLGG